MYTPYRDPPQKGEAKEMKRRKALELVMRMEGTKTTGNIMFSKLLAQFQVEFCLAAKAYADKEDNIKLTALREAGYEVSLHYLQNLQDGSPEKKKVDAIIAEWKEEKKEADRIAILKDKLEKEAEDKRATNLKKMEDPEYFEKMPELEATDADPNAHLFDTTPPAKLDLVPTKNPDLKIEVFDATPEPVLPKIEKAPPKKKREGEIALLRSSGTEEKQFAIGCPSCLETAKTNMSNVRGKNPAEFACNHCNCMLAVDGTQLGTNDPTKFQFTCGGCELNLTVPLAAVEKKQVVVPCSCKFRNTVTGPGYEAPKKPEAAAGAASDDFSFQCSNANCAITLEVPMAAVKNKTIIIPCPACNTQIKVSGPVEMYSHPCKSCKKPIDLPKASVMYQKVKAKCNACNTQQDIEGPGYVAKPLQMGGLNTNNKVAFADAVKQAAKEKDGFWRDPGFAPNAYSLDFNPTTCKWGTGVEWVPFAKLSDVKAPMLFTSTDPKLPAANPNDIRQGSIGDCWIISALSTLATRKTAPDLRSMFSAHDVKAGVFEVTFYRDRKPIKVCVDSLVPSKDGKKALFGYSADPNEIWPLIAEKAYAKFNACYGFIEAGYVDSALCDFTNGIGGRKDMRTQPQEIANGQLFKTLLKWNQQGYLMGCGSPAGHDDVAHMPASGIVQGHAYSILDVQEVDGQQFIRCRNPWGKTEWTGDFSDKSNKWTQRLKSKLNWEDQDDGAFWMLFKDFTQQFHSYFVCRIFDEKEGGWKSMDIPGEWKGVTAGGCINNTTVKDNPQYLLTVDGECDFVMQLHQEDTRGHPTKKEFFCLAIEIFDCEGIRMTREKSGRKVAACNYAPSRDQVLECTLGPNPSGVPYTLVVSTFDPKEEGPYMLTVYYKGANVKLDKLK